MGRLHNIDRDKTPNTTFKAFPTSYFGIDMAEVRTEQGKLHTLVAVGRTSKFPVVALYEKATTAISGGVLRNLLKAVQSKIHTHRRCYPIYHSGCRWLSKICNNPASISLTSGQRWHRLP